MSAGYHYIGAAGVALILLTVSLLVGAVCESHGQRGATYIAWIVALTLFVVFLVVTAEPLGNPPPRPALREIAPQL